MKKVKTALTGRRALEKRFQQFGSYESYNPPVRGWIRAVREALGMSSTQLAERMRVKQPTVTAFEQSEVKATIELATLKRAAEALDCTLVYALIPNRPLENIVRDKARAFSRRRLAPVEHSMALEDQRVAPGNSDKESSDREIDEVIRETNPRRFWE